MSKQELKKESSLAERVAWWEKKIAKGREKNKNFDFDRHMLEKMSQPSNYEKNK